jgi:2,3-bisphosphoglycerate-independent phosphoglycerate mutase
LNKEKKIVILIGDGMADYPIEELGGKTPLEVADIPNMDYLARNGIFGITKTVPDGMAPGSDTANLSIFGYDPKLYFTGRAPLEALNMNIKLGPNDVAFRCNLVNIENNIMKDYSSGQIDTEFSSIVINELNKNISNNQYKIELYPGVSYRNIMVWRDYPYDNIPQTTPPHDITGKEIFDFLPKGGPEALVLESTMTASVNIINNSDIIKKNRSIYNGQPTSTWLWGGGKKPEIETLQKRFGLHGYTISAVDLIHGIGRAAGLSPRHVDGATGYIDTNYSGKASALLKAIKSSNFVFLHVEAPDESGHEGNLEHKIKAIEDFDKKVVGPVFQGLKNFPDYTILVMPDHPTPIKLKTHTADPVPFCIYSNKQFSGFQKSPADICFTEKMARTTGNYIDKAYNLIQIMINVGALKD